MTSPQNGILLTIVTHEDVHLSIVKQKERLGRRLPEEGGRGAAFSGRS